ncbi:MAG: tetratricopeptide repeat protein [Myxococcales bacterium]|nr:MAG: tetratricopeptide repeat protein [Myxococcales bacterium]
MSRPRSLGAAVVKIATRAWYRNAVGYLGYYAAWLALSYVIRQPWLLVGLVALWLLRGVLPGPTALFGALSRAGRLRQQVELNRANVTARRDLATLYLELLRPRRALELLEQGLVLSPEDPELLYLAGVALHRAGQHELALARLLSAIEKDARLRHGHPYFVAGETLLALKRWDDAIDAFERYLDFNGSDVAAHTALSRAYAGAGNSAAARKWLRGGLETWHGLPGSLKRRQFGAYLRGQWARVTVLKQPHAIAAAIGLLAATAYGARLGYPVVSGWLGPSQSMLARARAAHKACGSQRTGDFQGDYVIVGEGDPVEVVAEEPKPDAEQILHIRADRIANESNGEIHQEYCFSRVMKRTADSLHAEAILRVVAEDGRPDDFLEHTHSEEVAEYLLYDVRLDRGSQHVRLRLAPLMTPMDASSSLNLRRKE